MAQMNLEQRFEAFVKTLDGFESIDALLQGDDPKGKKRADYLLENRQFVIEQKVLRSNPIGRPQKFVDKLAAERGFVFFGTLSTDYLFSRQPDAKNLQRRMVLDLSRIIGDIVANADKQTSDSREIFDIPDAAGILVLLNESASQLKPDVIHYALANSFQKKKDMGGFRYSANDGVILISEANMLATRSGRPAFPVLLFTSPETKHAAAVTTLSEALFKKWADFNNAPLFTVSVDKNLRSK